MACVTVCVSERRLAEVLPSGPRRRVSGRTRVPTLTPADLQEILDVRTAIDPLAAALAARHGTSAAFESLDANVSATARAATLAACA